MKTQNARAGWAFALCWATLTVGCASSTGDGSADASSTTDVGGRDSGADSRAPVWSEGVSTGFTITRTALGPVVRDSGCSSGDGKTTFAVATRSVVMETCVNAVLQTREQTLSEAEADQLLTLIRAVRGRTVRCSAFDGVATILTINGPQEHHYQAGLRNCSISIPEVVDDDDATAFFQYVNTL